MPSALDYMLKVKKLYGSNYIHEIKKHFGFFPFDVLSHSNGLVTREEFLKADHPIRLTADKKKWSCGLICIDSTCNESLIKTMSFIETHPFFTSVWNLIVFKTSAKNFATKKNYEYTLTNLNRFFSINDCKLTIKNNKFKKCFVDLEKIFDKIKNA